MVTIMRIAGAQETVNGVKAVFDQGERSIPGYGNAKEEIQYARY
jgi:hypothetical protein